MKHTMMKLLAAALTLALLLPLAVPASAEGPWAAEQSYAEDRTQEKVFAVRIESDEEEPDALRDRLLDAGFDAYLYEDAYRVYVFSGKFRDSADARAYKTELAEALDGVKLYTSRAWLPGEAVAAFEAASAGVIESGAEVSVYAVVTASSNDRRQAEAICETLRDKGFDAFLHEDNGMYQVLSGKFYDMAGALNYRDCVWSNTDRKDPYVTQVTVSEAAVDAFDYDLTGRGLPGPIKDNLEQPTGAFYRERDGEVQAYTVRVSAGTSFSGAERSRNAMLDKGYDSFVYEYSRLYAIMCGAFSNQADAEALCEDIRANGGRPGAVVASAWLPTSIVK